MPTDPTPSGRGLRRRLADARATAVGTRGLRSRLERQGRELAALREEVAGHLHRIERQHDRLKEVERQVKHLVRSDQVRGAELERREIQIGVLEVRLADLEERLEDGAGAAGSDTAGRDVLAEVRREHALVRVRMQAVGAYEERLRRVEESLAELYDGDPRHLV
jgi:chromosome segregation ATPase